MVKINFKNWDKIDPEGKYQITSNRITWYQINRSTNSKIINDFGEDYFSNFEHKFAINFSFIDASEVEDRAIIVIWECGNDDENKIACYAEQIRDEDNVWKIVFIQKENNENLWIYIGCNKYEVNKNYYISILRKNENYQIKVFNDDDRNNVIEDSGIKYGSDKKYRFLSVLKSINSLVDEGDWSNGFIESLNIIKRPQIEIPELKKEPESALISDVLKIDKFDIFIAYYRMTGADYAEHLKIGLGQFGIKSFLDIYDIPKVILDYSEEWRTHRDNALINSNVFLLIMTKGFEKRKEILTEIKLSNEYNIQKILYKQKLLRYDELNITIDGENIDLSKCPVHKFDTKEDLLRKIIDIYEELNI